MPGIGRSVAASGYRLPDRLEALPDESLSGLIMRYSSLYGFPNPMQLFVRLSGARRWLVNYSAVDPASEDGVELATCLGLTATQARTMSNFHPDRSAMAVGGHRVNVDFTKCAQRRACPTCLRDAPYHRSIWFVSAMTFCARHSTRILAQCPGCETPLRWSGPGVEFCQNADCSLDLRTIQSDPVAPGRAGGIQGLARLYDGAEGPGGLGFGDALKAALTIGAIRLGLPLERRRAMFVDRHGDQLPDILSAGWEAIEPWPSGFRTFLDGLATERSSGHRSRGFNQAYGPLATLIMRKTPDWALPLAKEMADHAARRSDVSIDANTVRRRGTGVGETGSYLSLMDAARYLEVSVDTVQALVKRLGFPGAPAARGEPYQLREADLRNLRKVRVDDGITKREAVSMLGVPIRSINQLVEDGTLEAIPIGNRVKRRLSLRRSTVEGLLRRIEQAAEGVPVVDDPSGYRRFDYLEWGTGSSFRSVCAAMVAGSLKPAAVLRSGSGLVRYLIAK